MYFSSISEGFKAVICVFICLLIYFSSKGLVEINVWN